VDEVRSASLVGGESDHPDGGVGERDARLERGPAEDGRALHAEEDQDAAEEALDAGALASFRGGPGRRQPVPLLLALGVPWDHSRGAQHGVDPGNEAQAPVAGIQAHDSWAQGEQTDGELQQRPSAGRIVDVGAGELEEQRQAGPATEQGVDAIAPQERTGMGGGRVAQRRIGIGPAPSQDRGAVDDEVTPARQSQPQPGPHQEHEEQLAGRGARRAQPLALLRLAGYPRLACWWQSAGPGEGGPGIQPVMDLLIRQAPERAEQRQQ
jgi:hypothetical protein